MTVIRRLLAGMGKACSYMPPLFESYPFTTIENALTTDWENVGGYVTQALNELENQELDK